MVVGRTSAGDGETAAMQRVEIRDDRLYAGAPLAVGDLLTPQRGPPIRVVGLKHGEAPWVQLEAGATYQLRYLPSGIIEPPMDPDANRRWLYYSFPNLDRGALAAVAGLCHAALDRPGSAPPPASGPDQAPP